MRPTAEQTRRRPTFRRMSVSLLVCFGQAVGAIAWLKAEGPIGWIFAYCAAVEALYVVRFIYRSQGRLEQPGVWRTLGKIATVGLAVLFVFGAAVIVVGLDITPASAYLAWFQLVQEGVAGGTLAYMFSVKFAYFGALFGGLILTGSVAFALLNLGAVNLLICAVLLGKPGLAAVGAVLFLVAVARYAVRRAGRLKARTGAAILQATAVAAIIALPFWAAHPRNRLIDDLFAIRMEGFVAHLFPNFPFLYNVPGYGYSLESTQIGNRPALTSRPVFEVSAPAGATVYIRTGVYDTYTGTGWELSPASQRTGEREVSLFETTANGPPALPTEQISFKVLIDFYSSLPHTLGTVAFRFPGERTPNTSFASLNSGFILDTPLRRGSEIDDLVVDPRSFLRPILIESPQYPAGATFSRRSVVNGFEGTGADQAGQDFGVAQNGGRVPGTQGATASRYRLSGAARNWRREIAAAQKTYGLQIGRYVLTPRERAADLQTDDPPKRLVQLAHELGAGKSEGAAINAIRTYLIDNFQYSLDTRPGGPYGDAVSDFLFSSKKGFCVQFASAFVILARLNGIPARYITGFLAELPPHATQMTVTGLSAHAWAEIWSDRRGWVTQEATPPILAAASGNPYVLEHYNPTDSRYTQRQLEAVLGGRLSASAAPPPPAPTLSRDLTRFTDHFAALRRIVAPAAAGLFALALLIWLIFRGLAPAESRLKRVVRKIARRSKGQGYPDPAQEGWREWSRELETRFPTRARVARRAAFVIHRSFFADGRGGLRTPGRDVDFLSRLYRGLLRGKKAGAKGPRPGAPVS